MAQGEGGTPLLLGITVLALDPDGVVCGATLVATAGQYGLLACYGDDPTMPGDEGAQPGDIIQLAVDDQILGMGTWTAHGERQWRPLGEVDLWQLYLPLIEMRKQIGRGYGSVWNRVVTVPPCPVPHSFWIPPLSSMLYQVSRIQSPSELSRESVTEWLAES